MAPQYRWLLISLVVTIIVVGSVVPVRSDRDGSLFVWIVGMTPVTLQKLLHVGLYAVLVLLLVWAMESALSHRARVLLAISLAVTLGAALEWAQTAISGRFGTLGDVLLNAFGALLGAVLAILLL